MPPVVIVIRLRLARNQPPPLYLFRVHQGLRSEFLEFSSYNALRMISRKECKGKQTRSAITQLLYAVFHGE